MSGKQVEQTAIKNVNGMESEADEAQPVEFFLYFPTEWDACVAKSCLMNLQFDTTIHYSESSDNWLCLAEKTLKPTSDRLMELGNFFDRLAAGNNGEYDGWGSAVAKEDIISD